ncbi:Phage tail tape measure protein [Paraburkholderia tropica]|uniref:phage tail tape measure protein n=1 Tax=Paraburkholderia tropica TaxID=92647 RepID=UPI001CB37949|nr:phage tail tape measure protein [Paraburkholderia tropica]CAG9195909.1 Phage tail tape measure protein [Paraburkholderia tropica]
MADKFQLKALITGVDKLSPALTGIRKNIAKFRKGLKEDGLGDIGFKDILAGGAIAAPMIAATKAAIDFESSMADVRKVVNFDTPKQFAEMSTDILDLSKRLPMAAADIAKIAAAGGQAGIDRSELPRFAEDAVKMGVAFDQTAEEAGQMMATWRTAFKMGEDDVVSLADKINYLGNTGPATAAKISDVVTRVGPLGKVAGLASGQIAALGATLIGVGVQQDIASTGIKTFMLTLASGSAATKQQQQMFKALRLNSKSIAAGLQKDAQGTMLKVLTAISKVKPEKQASVLQELFGRESIEAIAPLLTNLDLLQKNLTKVGDKTQYAGSMNQEYASRAATTANNMQLLENRITAVGISVGAVLLPPLNQFLGFVAPLIENVQQLAQAHPGLIKGVLGAALAFAAVRLAVWGVTAAFKAFIAVSNLTPLGIAVRVLALTAGFLMANWETVGPFFAKLWDGIVGVAKAGFKWLEFAFLNFSPLGLIIKNWEPIVDWFSKLWDRIKPYVQPLIDAAQWFGHGLGFGSGAPAPPEAPAPGGAGVAGWTTSIPGQPGAVGARDWGASVPQQAAQQRVNGELRVVFDNPPPGLRFDQPAPGNGFSITPQVGRRSLGGG